MATVRELRTKFTASAKSLRSEMKAVEKSFKGVSKSAEDSTKDAQRSYQKLVGETDTLKKAIDESGNPEAFKDLNKAIQSSQKEFKETGEVGEKTMAELKAAINQSGSGFSQLSAGGRQAISKIEKSVSGLESELKGLGKDTGLDDLNSQVEDLDANLGEAGGEGNVAGIAAVGGAFGAMTGGALAAVGAVAAVGAGIVGFIRHGDQLKGTLNGLQTATGATNEEMEGMRDSLVNIYANNYGESFDDIAKSMTAVKQITNAADDELEGMTQTAIMLRDTFEYEVNESTRAASALMKNFGVTGQEAYALIAEGSQKGLNYADDLLDTINEYSVYYEQAGFSAQEMFGMFKQAQETGAFNLDYAADAFKEFGIIMQEDSERAADALSMLGLNGAKLRNEFAQGGDTARQAFQTIATELSQVDDPLQRNIIGVELFGTKFEDLGADAVVEMSKANESIKGTADVLESIDEIQYDTIGETLSGVGRMVVANVLLPLQEKVMPGINAFVNDAKTAFGALFALFTDDEEEAASLLEKLGLSSGEVQSIINAVNKIQDRLSRMRDRVASAFQSIKQTATDVFESLRPVIRPALMTVVSFVDAQVEKIKVFWEENGAQILAAGENAFNGIMAVINFVMPFVLGLIKSIWGNIKGVITGALDVIMGAIKIFSGLFTGDFSKMWEGVKQLFSGAVTFLWNFIQLTFYGKILKGAKTFISAMRSSIDDMWKGIVAFFKGGTKEAWDLIRGAWKNIIDETKRVFNAIWTFFRDIFAAIGKFLSTTILGIRRFFSTGWQKLYNGTKTIFENVFSFFKNIFKNIREFLSGSVTNILNKVTGTWDDLFSATKRIFGNIKDNITGIFTDLVNAAKNLPGRLADGFSNMAYKFTNAIKKTFNSVATLAENGINGMITAINWILEMMTVDKRINPINIPELAQGTKGHPGGLAILGDGKGDNAGPEYVQTPDGKGFFSEAQDTLYNLPKGTRVMSARQTRQTFGDMVPKYALGNWLNNAEDAASNVWDSLQGKLSNVSQWSRNRSQAAIDSLKSVTESQFFDDWGRSARMMVNQAIRWGRSAGGRVTNFTDLIPSMTVDGNNGRGPVRDGALHRLMGGGFEYIRKSAIDMVSKYFPKSQESAQPEGYPLFPEPFIRNKEFGRAYQETGPGSLDAHTGWDFGAPIGTPIPAQARGRVTHSSAFGGELHITNGDMKYIYAHMKDRYADVGDWVNRNDIIGTVGDVTVWIPDPNGPGTIMANSLNNQGTTYPHVHYTVKRNGAEIDPYTLGDKPNFREHLVQELGLNKGLVENIAAPKQIRGYIRQAMDATGVPSSWLNYLETLVMKESGGNIHAQNDWDINAKSGTPSKGLAQVIPPTFAANKQAGMNDIWNPVHNVAAAINYIKRRYGNIANLPGFISMANGGPWKGYEDGGIVDMKQLAWIAEGGWAESIISHDPAKRTRQRAIWEETGQELGFTDGNSDKSGKMVELLETIASLMENGQDLQMVMDSREVGRLIGPHINAQQERNIRNRQRARGEQI